MKQVKIVCIALILGIVMTFGVAGCNAGVQNDLQSKIDDLQSQIAEMEDRLAEMDEQISERDAIIEDLNDQIKKQDEKIEQLEELAEMCTGTIYSLQEAYDNGWLTQENLQEIANYHHDHSISYPESLNDYIAKAVKKAWAIWEKEIDPTADVTAEKVSIRNYYGTYNDCVAVIAERSDAQYADVYAPITIEIGGVSFTYNLYHPQIVIFKF